jgi:hypothetical protein
MVSIGLSLLALSTAAIVAVAQPRPNDIHGPASDAVTVNVRAAAPTVGFAEASVAEVARIAGSREVSSTSERVTSATPAHKRASVVTDWSTHHVVFGPPKTEEQKARVERDTRYKMQVYRRNAPTFRKLADASSGGAGSSLLDRFSNRERDPHPRPTKASPIHRDWNVGLGGTGAPPPTVGASQFPAKFSFDINATPDCVNDFVVYNTNTNVLVAFNNLYTAPDGMGFCTGTGPNVMWAYNVATNGGVTSTSVTLSYDGTQVAFVESSSTGSVLHILKWEAGQGSLGSPASPQAVTGAPSDWTNCGGSNAGCIWNVPFAADPTGTATPTDSNSSPFYDYFNDFVYVGDDNGYIHKFVNVLNALPAAAPSEAAGNWPIWMDPTSHPAQTGPILDFFSNRIFAGNTNGELKYIDLDNTHDLCRDGSTNYPCLGASFLETGSYTLPDPPIVDSTVGEVFVFQGNDEGTPATSSVYQGSSTSCICAVGTNVIEAGFGHTAGAPLHSGDFDNNYYTTGAGYLYTCAVDATTGFTALRRVAIAAGGVMSGTADPLFAMVGTATYNQCSPVTEVYNEPPGGGTATDLIFFSIESQGILCADEDNSGGCLMSFDLTLADGDSALFPTLSASLAESGGTSGIIIDNVSTEAQASSVYFTPLGSLLDVGVGAGDDPCATTGCAIKATQVGLD